MRIPVKWLKDYIKTDKSPKELAKSLTLLGLMLDKPIVNNDDSEVLDLEHRMDRADWLSIVGCARDLAAFEGVSFEMPKLHKEKGREGGGVKIEVECPDVVNRFNTRVFRGVKVAQSPDWLKDRLEAYGIPSINNIVDITNFVMVELGQPMHAQDLSKMPAQEVVIRKAKIGEKVTTLLGETVELDEKMFVLTQNDTPTVIGGVVGGIATGVDETTTDIILDAGNYNQVNVRQTSRKLKIQNETVLRYDKFLHPMLTEIAIQRATYLILDLAGGQYYENHDWQKEQTHEGTLQLRLARVHQIGGITPDLAQIKTILTGLGYEILHEHADALNLKIPYFRTDVTVEDDIVADILRIGDYSNIVSRPINMAPPKEVTPKIYTFEVKLREICASMGAHEHITDPIVAVKGERDYPQIILENALSSDKNALRTTIEPGLKAIKEFYLKNKITAVALFEVGKVYFYDQEGQPVEQRVLSLHCFDEKADSLGISLRTRRVLMGLFAQLGIKQRQVEITSGPNHEIKVNGRKVGELFLSTFNIYTESLLNAIEINEFTAIKSQINSKSYIDLNLELNANDRLGECFKKIYEVAEVTKIDLIERYNETSALIRVYFDSQNVKETTQKIQEKIILRQLNQ